MAMRNDNQQTKKKVRLPLFDIALLLLIAIAVAAGSYWVTQRDDRETVTVQYAIRFENVENTYSGAIAEAKELFSVSGTLMGEVASARVTRSVEKTFDLHTPYQENGEYRYTETSSERASSEGSTAMASACDDRSHIDGPASAAAATATGPAGASVARAGVEYHRQDKYAKDDHQKNSKDRPKLRLFSLSGF